MRLIGAAMYVCKKRSLSLTLVVLLTVSSALSCAPDLSAEVPSPPKSTSSGAVEVQTLCDKVAEIKTLPHKDEPVNDPVYNALVQAGEKAIPCLIKKITDTTSMRDPRKAPGYAGIDNKVGDVALWVLTDITQLDFVELLPPGVQEDYKEEGVFAYFKYVQNDEHRKKLQDNLYDWYRKKYGKDAVK